MPASEYLAKLTQDDGATLLLRLAPNAYSQYSIDGTIWYDIATLTTSGSLEPVLVDGTTIKWVNGRLTATQELPEGGSAGQVLVQTLGGTPVWSSLSVTGYGEGLSYNDSTNTLSVSIDNSTIVVDSAGRLQAVPQIPTTGNVGDLLTKTSSGYAWAPGTQYTFSGGIANTSNTVSVVVDNNTIVIDSAGRLTVTRAIPDGGAAGQVLTKTSSGYAWDTATTYTFTSGLSASGTTVTAKIDGATIKLNETGELYAAPEIPNGGAVGDALLRSSGSTVAWGDPTSNLSFGQGVTRVGNNVSALVDGATVVINSSGQIAAVNVLPSAGSTGQVIIRDSNGLPKWETPASTIQFTDGLTTSGNAVSVYLDGETMTLDSAGRVTARSQFPDDGQIDQVLTKTASGVAWAYPTNALLFTDGLTQIANEVSVDVDETTITINNDGQLTAVSQLPPPGYLGQVLTLSSGGVAVWADIPYTFSSGLVRVGSNVAASVDGSTIVINSAGQMVAASQLPTGGSAGDVLTRTSSGYAWMAGQGGAAYTFTSGLTETSGSVSIVTDNNTIFVNSSGQLEVVNQIPATGTVGYVLTKTNDGYAWLPTQGGGGSGGSGGASYLFTDGLVETNGIVSVKLDGSTIILNGDGQLTAVSESLTFSGGLAEDGGTVTVNIDNSTIVLNSSGQLSVPLVFSSGLVNSSGIVTADVDNNTIVIDSAGKIAAVPELPTGGTTGQVLTVAGSSIIWNTPALPPTPVYPINTKKVSTLSLTMEEEEVPLYLVNSAGKMYNIEPGTSIYNSSTGIVTLDTTVYRAYENLGSNDYYEWDLIYLKNGNKEYENLEPFTLKAISGGTVKLGNSTGYNTGLYYRLGSVGTWTEYQTGTSIQVNQGDYIQFQGELNLDGYVEWHKFYLLGSFVATGNMQSMNQYRTTAGKYYRLFSGCTGLTVAGDILKATTPNSSRPCYFSLFQDCSSLTEIKVGLTTLNVIVWDRDYPYVTAAAADGDDPGVTPPAEYYTDGCLRGAFYGCSSLSKIEVNFTSWDYDGVTATSYWVSGVAASGVFIKPSALPEIYDSSHIPVGWTVINKDGDSSSDSSE